MTAPSTAACSVLSGTIADNRGSIIAVTNASGTPYTSSTSTGINIYDEYGVPASTNLGRFQYTGQAWVPETALYHYKARTYNPTLGRFLQTDPAGYSAGMNLYAYAGGGDPINNVDPSGLWCISGGSGDSFYTTCGPDDPVELPSGGGGGGNGEKGDTKKPKNPTQPTPPVPPLQPPPQQNQNDQNACDGSGQTPGAGGAAGQALNETGMPTVAKPGGIAGGGASGSVTSPASPILRDLTGGAKFAPLRLIFPTASIGGAIGRTIPVIGTIGIYLDYLDYLNSPGLLAAVRKRVNPAKSA